MTHYIISLDFEDQVGKDNTISVLYMFYFLLFQIGCVIHLLMTPITLSYKYNVNKHKNKKQLICTCS